MVILQNVSLSYNTEVEAISHINLSVNDGEFCFITGKSGSGKSTMSKILTGELKPTSGFVRVNGYTMGTLKPKELAEARRKIGMVFQDFRLISSMTVEENLEFAMRCVGASPMAIEQRIPEVLDMVSIAGKAQRYPSELSGGEQQRVAIARAIINHPTLILADEPTGNLDPSLAQEIMQLFLDINKKTGTTAMVITHAQELVDEFQKRVITLEGGRIIADTGIDGEFEDPEGEDADEGSI